jgi:hypothetical protein
MCSSSPTSCKVTWKSGCSNHSSGTSNLVLGGAKVKAGSFNCGGYGYSFSCSLTKDYKLTNHMHCPVSIKIE